jgi:hypothetical protein
LDSELDIPPVPCLEVCRFCHGERRREAREEVALVLAIGHALRAHEALGRSDALPGLLEVVHRLFEHGVFVSHKKSIRAGILRSLDCFAISREHAD